LSKARDKFTHRGVIFYIAVSILFFQIEFVALILAEKMSLLQGVRAATSGLRSLALTTSNNAAAANKTPASAAPPKRPSNPFFLFRNEKIKVAFSVRV
jgi:hypothetical protein